MAFGTLSFEAGGTTIVTIDTTGPNEGVELPSLYHSGFSAASQELPTSMSPTLRLCSRTREYRRLAATWAASTPSTAWVVEVGCHEGGA